METIIRSAMSALMDCIVSKPESSVKTSVYLMKNNKIKFLICYLISAVPTSGILTAQPVVPVPASTNALNTIYYSKQEKKSSQTSGYYEKTTDKYERGSVKLTIRGPLKYSVNPPELSISPNSSKTWKGIMSCNEDQMPEPGKMVNAKLEAYYDWTFSRPEKSGDGGKVLSKHTCEPYNPQKDNACGYHKTGQGIHEIVNFTGTESFDFEIYSIKVSLPDTIFISPRKLTGFTKFTANSFPETGGSFFWEPVENVSLVESDQKTAGIKLDNPQKTGKVQVTFQIEKVAFKAQAFVKVCFCTECFEEKPPLYYISLPDEYKTKDELIKMEELRLRQFDPNYQQFVDEVMSIVNTVMWLKPSDMMKHIIFEYVSRCLFKYSDDSALFKDINIILKKIKNNFLGPGQNPPPAFVHLYNSNAPKIVPFKADDDFIKGTIGQRTHGLIMYATKEKKIPNDGNFHCVRIKNWTDLYPYFDSIKPKIAPSPILSTLHNMEVHGSYEVKTGAEPVVKNLNLVWCFSDEMDANNWSEYKNKWVKNGYINNSGALLEILLFEYGCDLAKNASYKVRIYYEEKSDDIFR
jgi:hypothetical protein